MPLDMEIKTALEEQATTFEAFKAANDAAIKELKERGTTDPVLTEKVDRINAALTEAEQKSQKAYEKL